MRETKTIYAAIPKHWPLDRFISAINGRVRHITGGDLLYDTERAAIEANIKGGAVRDHFDPISIVLEVDR